MIGTHLGGQRETDPLEGWRALAAAVILQAIKDAREQPAHCRGRSRKGCSARGCSRCAIAFLKSEEGLALLSLLLGYPCTRQDIQAILICPLHLPYHARKLDLTRLRALIGE